MPEGVGYGPQYTSDAGLGLNYIGNHAWALSGKVVVDDNAGNLLDFTTGSNYIDAQIMFFYDDLDQGDNMYFAVYLSEQLIYSTEMSNAVDQAGQQQPVRIIIPSFTRLRITGQNTTDTNSHNIGATMRGRVYGKVD